MRQNYDCVSVYLPPDLKAFLMDQAAISQWSLNKLIVNVLQDYFAKTVHIDKEKQNG